MPTFGRQRRLSGIGDEGQARIRAGRVLIVGLGGLGCPAALYLARAGLGTLHLCDFDKVHLSNLHRQVLYTADDVHHHKARVAATRLQDEQPDLKVIVTEGPFRSEIVQGVDVVLDCTDEAGTRALIHQACMETGTPLVWAAVEGWEAQWAIVQPGTGPCLRCLWPSPADGPTCQDAGMIGPVVGFAGLWQALAALRLLVGAEVHPGILQLHDLRNDGHEQIQFEARAGCPSCAVVPKSTG